MHTATAQYIFYKRAIMIAGILLCLLAISYVVLVNQAVRHVVERNQLKQTLDTLGSAVSELEFAYIGQTNTITPERAAQDGFAEAHVTFVPRTPAVAVLTLNR